MSKSGCSYLVSFNDSHNDPTFASAEDCLIVKVKDSCTAENPCSVEAHDDQESESFFAMPRDTSDISKFCEMMGWTYDPENGVILTR